MKTNTLLIVLLFSVLMANTGFAGQYYEDKGRGWFWYEDPIEENDEVIEENSEESMQSSQTPKTLSPREILKKQGDDWEDAMAIAVLNPTRENYLAYMEKTTKIQ